MNRLVLHKRLKEAFWGILVMLLPLSVKAQNVTVEASIDSMQILIGEQTKVRLEVSLDAHQKMVLPVIRDTSVHGIEVLDIAKPDTQYLNNKQRLLVTQEYLVTSFDSAFYYIPPFVVTVDGKPYQSKSLALKVLTLPVPIDEAHPEQFFGPKGIMEAPFVWSDWALVIWLSLFVIPLVILVVYLVIRYKDNKPILRTIKVEPKLPPHQQALNEIERIKADKSWRQSGESKAYYTELTDTIRTYIKERFGFNALEMTSSEIIDRLLQEKDQKLIDELKGLFETADLVKFAKHHPLMNENDMNLINAIDFINQTKIEQDPNAKPIPTEITVEEKRSRYAKIALLSSIIILVVAIVGMLVVVIRDIYNLCF